MNATSIQLKTSRWAGDIRFLRHTPAEYVSRTGAANSESHRDLCRGRADRYADMAAGFGELGILFAGEARKYAARSRRWRRREKFFTEVVNLGG